jgi:hypothetical protein
VAELLILKQEALNSTRMDTQILNIFCLRVGNVALEFVFWVISHVDHFSVDVHRLARGCPFPPLQMKNE